MRLDLFKNQHFTRGASRIKEALWILVSGLFFSTWVPGSYWRIKLLRIFGADIGSGVVIKPSVRVKFPWKLSIGSNSWIGESVWIDNLGAVIIGSHVCISQGAYICTGSHNWSKLEFDLIVEPVIIENHVWVCAFALIPPGSKIMEGAIITFGSIAPREIKPHIIYTGTTPSNIKKRTKYSQDKL